MSRWLSVLAGCLVTVMLGSGVGLAQDKPARCDRAGSPEKVDGLVLSIDRGSGKLRVREANGTIREFKASKEALQDLKVGDRIEATLRSVPNC